MESSNLSNNYGKVNNPFEEEEAFNQTLKTNKKRNVTIAISLSLLLTLAVGALIGALIHESATESHSSKHRFQTSSPPPFPSPSDSNSSESLKLVCSVTPHPDPCFATISSLNSDDSTKPDPVHFFNLSLQVSIQELRNVSLLPKDLISKANDTGTESALKDCMSLFDDSLSELGRSLDQMKVGPNERVLNDMKISNMQTWISAAMTDQEGCLDGLEEMESSFVDEVKVKVRRSKVYMGNSLAIINNMEGLLEKFGMTLV